jgi:hypothetical protein
MEAAKRLLATQDSQSGLVRLRELNSLGKSMETLIISQRYSFIIN